MATILWYQDSEGQEKVLSENTIHWAKEKQSDVEMLYRYAKIAIEPDSLIQLRNEGKNISKSFKLFYYPNIDIIYIQSCFINTDERKRKMPFMFYTDSSNIYEAAHLLTICAKMAKKECSEDEINYLKSMQYSSLSRKDFAKWGALLLGITVISWWTLPIIFGAGLGYVAHKDKQVSEFILSLFAKFKLSRIKCGEINEYEDIVDYTRQDNFVTNYTKISRKK